MRSMLAAHDEVGELALSAASASATGVAEHAQHQPAVDEADRVVVGVEAEDLVDGDLDVVGEADEREVVAPM